MVFKFLDTRASSLASADNQGTSSDKLESFLDDFTSPHSVNAMEVVIILPFVGNSEGKRIYSVQNQCNYFFSKYFVCAVG